MNCPECRANLIELAAGEAVQIDVCPKGHGLWLDAGEINFFVENYGALKAAAGTTGRVAVAAQSAVCPRCGTALDSETVSGAHLSICPSCRGWWLAQGSLTRLNEAYRGDGAPIRFAEPSLYARAAAKNTAPPLENRRDRDKNLPGYRPGGLLFWLIVSGFSLLLAGIIVSESIRNLSSKAHMIQGPDRLFLYLIAGLAGGTALFAYGFILNRRKRLIESIPTSTVRSLAVGLVEVKGQAEADGASLTSPFSGMACVFYTYKVEERQDMGKNTRWVTIAKGTSEHPFYVRDATGRVLIVPIDARLELIVQHTVSNSFLGSLPPEAISGLSRLGVGTAGWIGDRPLRCHESCILPGETVYVLGTAQENPAADPSSDNAERLYIGPGHDGDYIISDRSEKELLSLLSWQVLGALYSGPALTLLCLFILLKLYGRA